MSPNPTDEFLNVLSYIEPFVCLREDPSQDLWIFVTLGAKVILWCGKVRQYFFMIMNHRVCQPMNGHELGEDTAATSSTANTSFSWIVILGRFDMIAAANILAHFPFVPRNWPMENARLSTCMLGTPLATASRMVWDTQCISTPFYVTFHHKWFVLGKVPLYKRRHINAEQLMESQMSPHFRIPTDVDERVTYKQILYQMVFDCKFDGERKGRFLQVVTTALRQQI
jgi:hypothetical protein